jgi:hypothetical protein
MHDGDWRFATRRKALQLVKRRGVTDVDPVPAGRYFAPFAEVVELVDALRSGRSGRKPVRVRVPPSAWTGVPGKAFRTSRPSNAPSQAQPARPTRLFPPPDCEPSRSPHL